MKPKFTIYLAEQKQVSRKHPDPWYHASLLLVNERRGQVVQELHFSNTRRSMKMQPYVSKDRRGMAYMHKEYDCIQNVLADREPMIRSAWNHMLKYAAFAYQNNIYYERDFLDCDDKDTINCLAGALAALESIGVIVRPGQTKSDIGTEWRNRLPLGVLFLLSSKPHQSLRELRTETDELSGLLTPHDWNPALEHDLGVGWTASL